MSPTFSPAASAGPPRPDVGDDHAVVAGQAERLRHRRRDGLDAHPDFLPPQLTVLLQLPERRRAVALGIAKPSPSLPPDCDRMNVFTPTTSPLMFTSGPPELPGLMGASVWM